MDQKRKRQKEKGTEWKETSPNCILQWRILAISCCCCTHSSSVVCNTGWSVKIKEWYTLSPWFHFGWRSSLIWKNYDTDRRNGSLVQKNCEDRGRQEISIYWQCQTRHLTNNKLAFKTQRLVQIKTSVTQMKIRIWLQRY